MNQPSRQWVLLRGLAREQGHWGPFKTLLEQADPGAEVLCVDLPGCGVYHRLSCPHKMEGIAEFVHSHLKSPKPKERYIISMSLGGMIATEMIRLYPRSFDGLVIINSSFRNLSPFYHRMQPEAVWHIFKAATAANLESKENSVLDMVSNRGDKAELAREWADIAREHPVTPKTFVKQLIAAARYRLPEEKPPIPVLVLTSEGDHMVNPECSKKLAERWHAPIQIHPSGGHELCLDEPEWVIDNVKQFFSI